MKKHRSFTLFALALMASFSALGGEVSTQRAKALGAKFVEANFKNPTDLEWVYTAVTENGRPSFHAFNGTADGFVIISACDLTSPVLGYSETGSFSTFDIPSGLQYFLEGYGQSVDYAEERLQKADFTIVQEWTNLERLGKTQATRSGGGHRSSRRAGTRTATTTPAARKTTKAHAKEPTSAAWPRRWGS